MSSKAELDSGVLSRRDVWLDEAFQVVTEGALASPNALQQALFPRLMTQDTGLLIPTGPAAGRLEAIVIPSLLGMRLGAAAHRLFIVGPDNSPLDDYFYRLNPYVRALVVADGMPRTIWFEEPERTPIARKYLADGSTINGAADHPFSEEVDIVVMPFSHFRTTFFSSGGVHGVPEVIGFDGSDAQDMGPRGLFYFDEAYGASREQMIDFRRMAEFLFAQDLDIVVGGSSLPSTAAEELSYLELVSLPEADSLPPRGLQYVPAGADETLARMERAVEELHSQNTRGILTLNDPADDRLDQAYARLSAKYQSDVYLYRTSASRAERGYVYARLRELEKMSRGYLLIVDGPALEVSDLDARYLITETCGPLSLMRRAGRCNRRGTAPDSTIVVVGDARSAIGSEISNSRRDAYLALLESAEMSTPLDVDLLKRLAF